MELEARGKQDRPHAQRTDKEIQQLHKGNKHTVIAFLHVPDERHYLILKANQFSYTEYLSFGSFLWA